MGWDDLGDRVVGCVIGLALGEAAGTPVADGTATAMARNVARSLASRGRLDVDDVAARHLAWFRSDPHWVEGLTRRVLARAAAGEAMADAAAAIWAERGPEVSAGNGSVAYCAPLGVAYAHRPQRLFDLAPRLSALTHVDPRCQTAVLAVTLVAAGVARGAGGRESAEEAVASVQEREGGEELEFLVEAAGGVRPVNGPDRGFCLFAAALGVQAVARGRGFEDGVRGVVALGGATGSNAAVTGALLGAAVGRARLSDDWLRQLADGDAIRAEAEALIPLAARS